MIDFDKTETHPSYESFEKIWEDVIEYYISEYLDAYDPIVALDSQAKNNVWETYSKLNKYCKKHYMKDITGRLDRHKVAACYIIAIATVRPMYLTKSYSETDVFYNIINELLALSVGFSVLRAYIESSVRNNNNLDTLAKEKILEKYKEGIKTPGDNKVQHGTYITNYASELHYAVNENCVCILSIAHELFLLERYTELANDD